MLADYFLILKQGGCAFQIKIAIDQENILDLELCKLDGVVRRKHMFATHFVELYVPGDLEN